METALHGGDARVPDVTALIEVDELVRLLETDVPPVVADVRWNLGGPAGLGEFEAGHVPGAQWVDLENELSRPHAERGSGDGGRHPLPDPEVFGAAMRRIGVTAGRTVVVCDGATALAASRLWWVLTDAGHTDVRVLNGGVAAWVAANGAVQTGPAQVVVAGDFVPAPGRRRILSGADVAALVASDGGVLVDVRAPERYAGVTEPIDPVAGHIPSALNLPSMVNLRPDGRFTSADLIAERYADAAVGESPVLYCGSGITAAHSLLALESVGIMGGGIYPGSWSDWITDPDRPVATGEQP